MTSSRNRLVRALSWPLIRRNVLSHLSGIEGLEHIPTEGPFVLAPNHTSYYDHFLLLTVLRALRTSPTWFVTKSEAFVGPASRAWHEAWYSISVDRGGPTTTTLREIRSAFAAEDALCVYPEGTRGPGGALLPFKDGAFRFGILGDVPVIPVGIDGSNRVLPRGAKRTSRESVRVVFGAPLHDPRAGANPARARAMREEGRGVIGELVTRASATDCGRSVKQADAAARLIDSQITALFDERGRLAADQVRRLRLLARLAQGRGPGSVDLDVQQVRLVGLRATNAPRLLRPILAAPVRIGAQRVLRTRPDHAMANYLLGRWYLLMPSVFGGGAPRAVGPLTMAAASSPAGDTRALGALAEAHLACGHPDAARIALLQIIAQTLDERRGPARIARAHEALSHLPTPRAPAISGAVS